MTRSSPATGSTVLAEVISQPFDSIASEVNRRSLNIGAELLLRWAGGDDRPADRLTAHVQQTTGDYTSVHLVDGSGLSHDDRASPLAFIGNVEARHVNSGDADVIVADGFTGNIALKVSEGLVASSAFRWAACSSTC